MNDFYRAMTIAFVIAIFILAFMLLLTFDPIGKTKKLIRAFRSRRTDKRIEKARETIDRFTPEAVLTENEIKKIVLSYLDTNGLIVAGGDYGNECN